MRILTGEELKKFIEKGSINRDNKYCHILAKEFIRNLNRNEQIKIPYLLSGNSGCGKTNLLESCIKLIDNYEQTVYITFEYHTLIDKYQNNYELYFNELMEQLSILKDTGIKNIFIDDITILKDYYYFGNNQLPDFLAYHFAEGLKIITGKNSLLLAETINSDDSSRVRYFTRYLPKLYTYSDYLKANECKHLDNYLRYGGLVECIDARNNIPNLTYFVYQKNLLLEEIIYKLYRNIN